MTLTSRIGTKIGFRKRYIENVYCRLPVFVLYVAFLKKQSLFFLIKIQMKYNKKIKNNNYIFSFSYYKF